MLCLSLQLYFGWRTPTPIQQEAVVALSTVCSSYSYMYLFVQLYFYLKRCILAPDWPPRSHVYLFNFIWWAFFVKVILIHQLQEDTITKHLRWCWQPSELTLAGVLAGVVASCQDEHVVATGQPVCEPLKCFSYRVEVQKTHKKLVTPFPPIWTM